MCYNCGCRISDDDMGHPDNITTLTFKELGKTLGKKEPEARQIVYEYLEAQLNDQNFPKNDDIEKMFVKASKAWGQGVKEAKKQTYNMLRNEL